MMRYLPHTQEDIQAMLQVIGVADIDALFEQIPQELRDKAKSMDMPAPLSELALKRHLESLAAKNRASQPDVISFLGAGLYNHLVPEALPQLISRAEFLTSYTPYQPEISQGTTKAIFEFQSMIAEILDMPVANASMYDGAHATAEAVLMAQRVTRRKKVLLADNIHPEYLQVVHTYLRAQDDAIGHYPSDLTTGQIDLPALIDSVEDPKDVACVVFQTPNFWGVLEEPEQLIQWAHGNKIMVICCFNEPHAFSLTKAPGSYGVDICVGEASGLGVGLGYGGPALGVFACQKKYLRAMPGRLAGRTQDTEGREGYVLTLSTREQHIRREKATSNICTNQGLMALAAAIYMSLMGKEGMRDIARLNLSRAHYAMKELTAIEGIEKVYQGPYFNEFVLKLPVTAKDVVDALARNGIVAGYDLGRVAEQWRDHLLVAVTEMNPRVDIDTMVNAVRKEISAIA